MLRERSRQFRRPTWFEAALGLRVSDRSGLKCEWTFLWLEDWRGKARLEFCPEVLPEFVLTGHEVVRGSGVELPERHRGYFELITAHPDIFPGFHHFDLASNVRPKLELLQRFGFYVRPELAAEADPESCGAHSLAVGG